MTKREFKQFMKRHKRACKKECRHCKKNYIAYPSLCRFCEEDRQDVVNYARSMVE